MSSTRIYRLIPQLSRNVPTYTLPTTNTPQLLRNPIKLNNSSLLHKHTTLLARYPARRSFFWSTSKNPQPDATTSPIPQPPTQQLENAPSDTTAAVSAAAVDTTTPSFLASDPAIVDAAVQQSITAVSQIGDMKTLGLCNFTPAGFAQQFLEAVYVTTGLPWWATIMVATVIIRTALTPLIIKVQRTSAKMHNISHKTKPLQEEMMRLKNDGDMVGAQKTMMKLRDEYKKEGVHPLGGLVALVQAPVFISFFFGLKAMAELPVPGFETGGLYWFTDLTQADPTYILPILANLGMLGVMEVGAEMGGQANAAQTKGMKNFLRIALVASIPFTAQLPSAIFMYWVSTNVFSLLQAIALKQPALRRAFNIPQLDRSIVPKKGIAQVSKLTFADSMKMVKQATEERQRRAEVAAKAAARITQASSRPVTRS